MVRANNNAAAAADAARRFVVGGAVVGRLLEQSADALGRHPEVFSVSDESVTLRAEAGATSSSTFSTPGPTRGTMGRGMPRRDT